MIIPSLLDTDLYKFTMMQVVLHHFPGAQVEYRFKCRNPDVDLWIQSTTLQTALMQAYMAFRLADLLTVLGGTMTVAGVGIASSGRRA